MIRLPGRQTFSHKTSGALSEYDFKRLLCGDQAQGGNQWWRLRSDSHGLDQKSWRSGGNQNRDNGTGMTSDVKEKMFNPFFTTKPSGEGTGLGLSISHDIIVKQHGGSIEVDTQPGKFTEITVILPRAAALLPERP